MPRVRTRLKSDSLNLRVGGRGSSVGSVEGSPGEVVPVASAAIPGCASARVAAIGAAVECRAS